MQESESAKKDTSLESESGSAQVKVKKKQSYHCSVNGSRHQVENWEGVARAGEEVARHLEGSEGGGDHLEVPSCLEVCLHLGGGKLGCRGGQVRAGE